MTDSVIQELGHTEDKGDGVFYMDMESFFDDFNSMDVAAYQDWKQTSTDHEWDRTSYDKEFSINNPV